MRWPCGPRWAYIFGKLLTDSRSFLSFPRQEYFRRILCNLIGRDVVAELRFGLLQANEDLQAVVEFAAAALKHYIPGDFNLCSEAEVRALMAGSSGGRVKR